MEKTKTEWLEAFAAETAADEGTVECDLARSLHDGSTSVEVVSELMQHHDQRVRSCVAWALHEQTANVATFLSAVLDGFDDPSSEVRYWCVLALEPLPPDRRVEAIIRLIGLAADVSPPVRRAACNVVQKFERDQFTIALDADLTQFGLTESQIARLSQVREELAHGYRQSLTSSVESVDVSSLTGIAQAGYGIGLGYRWREFADAAQKSLASLNTDVRFVLVSRVEELLDTILVAVRELARDPDPDLRWKNWNVPTLLMRHVGYWRRMMPGAVCDDDNRVRHSCLGNLRQYVDTDVLSAIAGLCSDSSDEDTSDEAMSVLSELTWESWKVVETLGGSLETFLTALADPQLPTATRQRILSVLHGYCKTCLHEEHRMDCAAVLKQAEDDGGGGQ